jgi:hypothetical protein
MLQKYLWGGAALILLGAAAAFVAVDYALCHPASMLARFGVAATFAGLNPNPLSDVNPAVSPAQEHDDGEAMESEVPSPSKPDAALILENSIEETIEPIQVESVPPATAEPPTGTEESAWNGPWRPVVQGSGNDPGEQAPRPMPYADEETSDKPQCEGRCNALKVLNAISTLRSCLPSSQVYEEAEEFIFAGDGCGCLNWLEYDAPEEVPVAPREQRQNEQGDESCHQGCYHGCGDRCGSPCCPPSTKACEELPPPLSQPCVICTFWDKNLQVVKVASDPTSDGVMAPFLTGRLVLFGSNEKPVCCNGTAKIALYDTRPEKGGPWVKLESWTIDREMLQNALNKDAAGFWGYTLSLPMPAATTPSSTRAVVEFTTDSGETLFATSSSMQLVWHEAEGGAQAIPDPTEVESPLTMLPKNLLEMHWDEFGSPDQPSHLTPDRVDGGIAPSPPGIDGDEEESEQLQDPGCQRGCHNRCWQPVPGKCGPPFKCGAKACEKVSVEMEFNPNKGNPLFNGSGLVQLKRQVANEKQ